MVELKEKQVEKIKNAKDGRSVESVIDTSVLEMKENGIEDYRIANFLKRLDLSLMLLDRRELTEKQWNNIKHAQKILINKIVHGSRHHFVKK